MMMKTINKNEYMMGYIAFLLMGLLSSCATLSGYMDGSVKGQLKDVELYDRVIGNAQIREMYLTGKSASGLIVNIAEMDMAQAEVNDQTFRNLVQNDRIQTKIQDGEITINTWVKIDGYVQGKKGDFDCSVDKKVMSKDVDGSWHMVTCVFNKERELMQFYMDGVLKNESL